MPELAPIGLRRLGLLLVAVCAPCVVLLIRPGPAGLSDAVSVLLTALLRR